MYESATSVCLHAGTALRRIVLAILVAAPFGYFGMLLAVAVHEFFGHGLVSLAVGGDFRGVMLNFDGMGWALVPMDSPTPMRRTLVLLGGPSSTMIVGLVLLWLSWRLRRMPHIALPFILIAANHAAEGSSYAFWNAVHVMLVAPDGAAARGDIGRAAAHFPAVLWPAIVIGGLVIALTIWCVTAVLLWLVESYICDGARLRGRPLIVTIAIVAAALSAAWFVFDWDNLLPGLGHWPNFAAVALHFAAGATLLIARPPVERVRVQRRAMFFSAMTGFALVLVSIAIIGLWLRHGVTW